MKDSPERSRVSNIIDHISLIFLFAELKHRDCESD